MKQKVPMLVKNRKPLYSERKLGKPVKSIAYHTKQKRANINGSILFISRVHVCPQEQSRRDNGDYENLHCLKNVDERVSLDEEPLFVEIGLEKLPFGYGVFFEDKGRLVSPVLIVSPFSLGASEAAGLEEVDDMLAWALIHDLTFG
ncbi:altered inheritance of mitochondria protein 36 [Striga asiatica]|uniref:Altered inheritance of mitochondria protein 36 n=1 Tax=Striga asiatica TaxID=4170 RepID=A0A5A7R7R9_STRAF|nr:altered inheritance of mitochondria protein 36 [Striga asiatica]